MGLLWKFSKSPKFRSELVITLIISLATKGAAALFEGCDTTFDLSSGVIFIESPYYPNNYPSGTSCRYTVIAPLDYEITVSCSIKLDKNPDSCSTEFLYLSIDGDLQLRGSEQFCGEGQLVRKSLFRRIVMAYTSSGRSSGRFKCRFSAAPQPCDCGWSAATKIVNGGEAQRHQYPSMVALRNRDSMLDVMCGGAIISHRYIVTAAHCTRQQPNTSKLLALVGRHNMSSDNGDPYAGTYEIQRIIEHPEYSHRTARNDIALLSTKTDIQWSRGVGPICLPLTQPDNDFAYRWVDAIGWGTTSFGGPMSNVLRKVSLQIMRNVDCQRAPQFSDVELCSSEICTYDYTGTGRDSCQGDSGGPVVLRSSREFLLAIVSYGEMCGKPGYAIAINTRITSYLDWIVGYSGRRGVCSKEI